MMEPAIVINWLALIWPVITAIKQKHYVKKSDAAIGGLHLIVVAVTLLATKPSLTLWQLPLFTYPLVIGLAGIGLVVKNEKIGLKILSGWITSAILAIVLIVQYYQ